MTKKDKKNYKDPHLSTLTWKNWNRNEISFITKTRQKIETAQIKQKQTWKRWEKLKLSPHSTESWQTSFNGNNQHTSGNKRNTSSHRIRNAWFHSSSGIQSFLTNQIRLGFSDFSISALPLSYLQLTTMKLVLDCHHLSDLRVWHCECKHSTQ